MCRLLGVHAKAPVNAHTWLVTDQDSLLVESYRNPDGAGIGWFDADGSPALAKEAEPAYRDSEYERAARTAHSRTFVAHVRAASTGKRSVVNTHPFEMDGRLLAQNGAMDDLAALESHLGAGMSLVHGQTDSERFLALATVEARPAGADIGVGLAVAARWAAASLPVLALNSVVITATDLWALRYPDTHSLFVREMRVDDVACVVVASERLDGSEQWRMLEPGELVHVDRDGVLTSQVVVDHPPAQPLVLSERDPNPET
jgi:glutamine amidotransferase